MQYERPAVDRRETLKGLMTRGSRHGGHNWGDWDWGDWDWSWRR